MGIPISLALRGRHTRDGRAQAAWAEVMAELRHVDLVFSTWRADSWVSRLARGEVVLGECPGEVAEVMTLGERASEQSGGAFAVSWTRSDGAVVLDPSGVVKGWAIDRASRFLRELPETDFCLNGGGDMVVHTADPGGEPWGIGIEDPRDPQRLIARVPVARGAVATSGSAHRGAHVVDARTGVVPEGVVQVTVIGDSLTWVDIEATAAYAMGRGAADWLRTRPGRTGVVVWEDGTTELVA